MIGEYWFIDGMPTSADGDINDQNHESVVVERAVEMLQDSLECNDADPSLQSAMRKVQDCIEACTVLCNWSDEAYRAGRITEEENDDYRVYLAKFKDKDIDQCSEILFNRDSSPKCLATQYWGWVRVRDDQLTCWKVDAKTMSDIVDGIYEVCPEVSLRSKWTLEVQSSQELFVDVPLIVLDSAKSILKLRNWKRKQSVLC